MCMTNWTAALQQVGRQFRLTSGQAGDLLSSLTRVGQLKINKQALQAPCVNNTPVL